MAGKTNSAAKPMHDADPFRQWARGLFGPLDDTEIMAHLIAFSCYGVRVEEAARRRDELRWNGEIMVALASAGDDRFFEQIAKAIRTAKLEHIPVAEPWRYWLIKTYRLPTWVTGEERRKPETVERILHELGVRFEYYPDAKTIRKELRLLGIPFVRGKAGRPKG
ncbi:MAG: hypothetical protein E6Q97_17025 [Desulfurellales bacterium]|nr:MAG: hypothetical protein E6Q97_17025 [Desulfurellales bacterium]